MATTLAINTLRAAIGWNYSNSTSFGADTNNQGGITYTKTLTNGSGAGNAQKIYVAAGTIAGAGTLNLDLAASLVDVFGNSITFANIKVLYVELTTATTATSIKVGGADSAPFVNWIVSDGTITDEEPGVIVRNGGMFMLACTDATGYAVTATTGDILKLTNLDASNTATYRVCLIGA